MSESIQETTLASLTDDLAGSFFDGTGSSTNVILPNEPGDKPIDKVESTKTNEPIKHPQFDFSTDDIIGDLLKTNVEEATTHEPVVDDKDDTKKGPGRPKKVDTELGFEVDALFEDDLLFPFEDDTPVNSVKELKDLIKGNIEDVKVKSKTEGIKEYKESLPDTVKFILDYTEQGGSDIENLLKTLGQTRQIADLDIEQEFDQKEVIRQYYGVQGWTPAEIESEIEDLKDSGSDKLKNAAVKLKPKLDRQQEQVLAHQMQVAAQQREQQEQAKAYYEKNIVDTLKRGSLGDMKLSKDDQKDIYSALVTERYKSIDGSITNRLGALLDKIQFADPNYELLAEVTMLLSDREAFKTKIREQIKKEVTADTVKTIKGRQGLAKSGTTIEQPANTKTIKRLGSGFINPFG